MDDLVRWLGEQLHTRELTVPGWGWHSKEELGPGSNDAWNAVQEDISILAAYRRARQQPGSGRAFWLERTVVHMAAEHSDRPGYREEWRP